MLYNEAIKTADGYAFRILDDGAKSNGGKAQKKWATIYKSTTDGVFFGAKEDALDAGSDWLDANYPDDDSETCFD